MASPLPLILLSLEVNSVGDGDITVCVFLLAKSIGLCSNMGEYFGDKAPLGPVGRRVVSEHLRLYIMTLNL